MNSIQKESYDLFRSNYEQLSGKVYLAGRPAEAAAAVGDILRNCNASKAVVSTIPADVEQQLHDFSNNLTCPIVALKPEAPDIPNQINEADVGMSEAVFAIATTGTIVEVSLNDAFRLISSLPKIHVAFLSATTIIHSLEEAAAKLREIYEKNGADCNITFVSGPSRTADIEMKLFLGVHGPQESHVIVCDWSHSN